MQAITTKYLPATNTKPSRIVASAQAGRLIVSCDGNYGTMTGHEHAARAFAEKFGWHGQWVGGSVRNGDSVWVCVDQRNGYSFTIAREAGQ